MDGLQLIGIGGDGKAIAVQSGFQFLQTPREFGQLLL